MLSPIDNSATLMLRQVVSCDIAKKHYVISLSMPLFVNRFVDHLVEKKYKIRVT